MKRNSALLGIMMLLIALPFQLWAEAPGNGAVIRVAGSDSMFFRVRLLGKLFTKANPAVTVDVSQGGTMESGVQAVIKGDADLAMLACSIRPDEEKLAKDKNVKLVERLIGYGGVAILANASAGVEQLSIEEVKKLFTGEYTNWKQVGGADVPVAVVRTDETHPGTLAFLQRDFMQAPFTGKAAVVSTFPGVVATVADNPGSIGYIRVRETEDSPVVKNNPRVKVIPLSRSKSAVPVYPSRDTVSDHSYPLLRPYFVYYLTSAKKDAVKFADYLVKKGWGAQDL